jgi:hypothetical protein
LNLSCLLCITWLKGIAFGFSIFGFLALVFGQEGEEGGILMEETVGGFLGETKQISLHHSIF